MTYRFEDATAVLRRTPGVLDQLLRGLPEAWSMSTEGPNTWSPYDVVGHLIHAERTNWLPRIEHLLNVGEAAAFPPFDREAMFAASKGKSLGVLLDAFAQARRESLARFERLGLSERDLTRRGTHPQFGPVTLGQLLSTWVVHDLTHLSQVVRVMAHQYGDAVGPWSAYLSVLTPRTGKE